MATRVSGGKVLNAFAKNIPWLLGGSADLAPSTKTLLTFDEAGGDLSADNPGGRNLHFGIREHGMVAAVNGMVLCGLRAYGATFFVFTDYCRPSLRLAAIMEHSVDHRLHARFDRRRRRRPDASAGRAPRRLPRDPAPARAAARRRQRSRPNAWQHRDASKPTGPSLLVLTRQDLPTLDRTKYAPAAGVARGGYVLADAAGKGQARRHPHGHRQRTAARRRGAREARRRRHRSRVVSLPSFELFDEQPAAYRDEVLPPAVTARVAVEAGVRQCWDKYLGSAGAFVGLDTYGASAPYQEIYKHRGLTAEAVLAKARELCGRRA